MEERLKRRKLDALKRGVHRITGGEGIAMSTHVVGIGKAGAGVIAETLRSLEPDAPKLCALVVDIGDHDFTEVRALAAGLAPERAEVTFASLECPSREALITTLADYRDYLQLEYPRYRWNASYQPWLPDGFELPPPGGHYRRAVAKALYGASYYAKPRAMEAALRRFAASVDALSGQAMVAIVFGLGGGTGSGIAPDLARHLSNRIFGRRVLVAGIGIAPCDGDLREHTGGSLFALLNELDALGDEGKNHGVVMACGELFRNPFTAGFILVPQDQAWAATHDLVATQRRGNEEIASLLTGQGGKSVWEVLRLLNWVAAPSTQHSAARTPWGPRWIHTLAYADVKGAITAGEELPERLGLMPSYVPEFIEIRTSGASEPGVAEVASAIELAFTPDAPVSVVGGGRSGSVQFILPCSAKTNLRSFGDWRTAYRRGTPDEKLLDHALLLDQGVLLSEPSTRLEGMAGASLWGGDSWVAVRLADLTGEEPPPPPPQALPGMQQVRPVM